MKPPAPAPAPRPEDRVPLLKKLGPGLITGAADDDPSGIATYSQAGAQFGYGLLWSVLITTPAAEGYPLVSKITRPIGPTPDPYTAPEYACPPPKASRRNRRGMWVIGHDDYDKTVICSTAPSLLGQIDFPRVEWRAVDRSRVVCVAPAEWEGGVLHDGRPYTAP